MSRELRANRRGNAIRGTKIKDQPPVHTRAKNSAGGASLAPNLPKLTQALALCRQQMESARHEIDALAARNAMLEQALRELTHKEAQARQMAYYDSLTGLANRNLLQDRFSQAISQAERRRKPLALLLLDLDQFKCVNDKLGHSAGDKLLQAVAQRLAASIRGMDTACRYGGDEFVLMLPEISKPSLISEVVSKVHARLSKPYIFENYAIHITASVGCAMYPSDGKTYDDLIKRADNAMYGAKGAAVCKVELLRAPIPRKAPEPQARKNANGALERKFITPPTQSRSRGNSS